MELIADNVVRLGTRIINWFLLADDTGVTVVDAAVPGYHGQLEPGLRELGRAKADVKAVVLTHAHSDHVGSAERLRRELGVPVYIHGAERDAAAAGKPFGLAEIRAMLPYFRHSAAPRFLLEFTRHGAMKANPIAELRTFGDGEELALPGRPRVIHTPGHTEGHVVFVSGDYLFGGDAICTLNPLTGERGPQVLPAPLNRSTPRTLDALERLKGSGATVLLPAHGEPAEDVDAAATTARTRGVT